VAKAFASPRLYGGMADRIHVHLLKIVSKEKSAPGGIPQVLEPLTVQASWVALDVKGNVVREAGTDNVVALTDEKIVAAIVGVLARDGASKAAALAETYVLASLEKK
jgi:hypothetical protein